MNGAIVYFSDRAIYSNWIFEYRHQLRYAHLCLPLAAKSQIYTSVTRINVIPIRFKGQA